MTKLIRPFICLGTAILLLYQLAGPAEAQMVGLRHPNDHRTLGVGHLPAGSPIISDEKPLQKGPVKSVYTTKPGDVLVQLDKNHNIKELKYVLHDGQMATLFQRQKETSTNSTR